MNPEQALLTTGILAHRFVTELPLPSQSAPLEYWMARNGIFARAERPGIQAMIPVAYCSSPVKGLRSLTAELRLTPRIPQSLLMQLWRMSIDAARDVNEPKEQLFYFLHRQQNWQLYVPAQTQTATSCQADPSDPHLNEIAIEIHSHQHLAAQFSEQDTASEVGFRLYGIIGKVLNDRPQLNLRVTLYRHCWQVPIESVFDCSVEIEDCSTQSFYYHDSIAQL